MPRPCSRAISAVSSTGKPWVSCRSKTSPACSVDSPALACHAHEIVEQSRARLQRAGEALLLGLEQAPDVVAMTDELGEAGGQRLDHGLVHGAEEGRLEAEARAVQDGAPDDPAQHIATALVGGRDAVGRDRAHAAGVIAEHAERAHGIAAIGVATAREALQGLDHVTRLVGLEEAADALQEHGDSLDAAARVDVLRRKRRQGPVVSAIELHEDEIPELEEAIAVAPRRALGPAAAELLAAVVVELRARAAWPCRPGLPEVVLAQRDDALGGDALPEPEIPRDVVRPELVVALVHGRPDALGVEPPCARRELVGHLHGARLEVVAE